MLQNHILIKQLIARGVITNAPLELVNATSLDVTLGSKILEEAGPRMGEYPAVEVGKDQPLHTHEIDITYGYVLAPGAFILAHSQQIFNLPNNISAEYKLKSSMARLGLEHLNAGWCDPGWTGSALTLELKNMTQNHNIVLRAGCRIGQVVFFSHMPVSKAYSYANRGRYNGDTTVRGVKAQRELFPVGTAGNTGKATGGAL